MSVYLLGLVWVAGATAVAGTVAFLISRRRPGDGNEADLSAVGTAFTLVGGMHAVLLVFVLIALFDATATAEEDSYREAEGLVAISWASTALPEPARTEIQKLSRSYADTVIEQEWPRMRAAEDTGDEGWAQLDRLRLAIERADATAGWQEERKSEAANQLWEVYQARQDRLNASGSGVSLVMWFALIIGSVITVVLTYLNRGTKLLTHVVVVSTLVATIVLLLFAIYQLQNPFGGGASVGPEAFQATLERLG
jgi:hypothetical protein